VAEGGKGLDALESGGIEQVLSGDEEPAFMTSGIHVDTEKLFDEIARYLAVVDVFRSADCEPRWRPEAVGAALPAPTAELVEQVRSVH
jgi:hypothetical protein